MDIAFYRKNGVKIGFIPSRRLIYQSRCFRKYYINHENVTAGDATAACPNGLGLSIELCLVILDILQIPKHKQFFQPLTHGDYGRLVNGSWSGVVGDIMAGTYDTSIPEFTPVQERLKAIDFSNPLMQSHITYATRKPDGDGEAKISPLSVFSMLSWTIIIGVGGMVGLLLVLDQTLCKKGPWKLSTILHDLVARSSESMLLFTGFAVAVSRSTKCGPRGSHVVLGFWALGTAIIAGLYSGTILLKIIQHSATVPFRDVPSLAACVAANKCYLVTNRKTTVHYQRLVKGHSLSSSGMLLHLALKKNPIHISQHILDEIFSSTSQEYHVYFSSKVTLDIVQAGDKQHSSKQYFVIDGGYPDPWCFPAAKNTNLAALLSEAIAIAQEGGLIDALYSKYLTSVTEQQENFQLYQTPQPLNTAKLTGTLMILVFGGAVGFLVFLAENLLQLILSSTNASQDDLDQDLNVVFHGLKAHCCQKLDYILHIVSAVELEEEEAHAIQKLQKIYEELQSAM